MSGVGLGSRLVGLRVCRVSRACKANTKPLPKVSIVVPVFGLTKYIIRMLQGSFSKRKYYGAYG